MNLKVSLVGGHSLIPYNHQSESSEADAAFGL